MSRPVVGSAREIVLVVCESDFLHATKHGRKREREREKKRGTIDCEPSPVQVEKPSEGRKSTSFAKGVFLSPLDCEPLSFFDTQHTQRRRGRDPEEKKREE